MAINTSKVVVGGLAAGIVANIIGYVLFGMMLGPRMEAEADENGNVRRPRGVALWFSSSTWTGCSLA